MEEFAGRPFSTLRRPRRFGLIRNSRPTSGLTPLASRNDVSRVVIPGVTAVFFYHRWHFTTPTNRVISPRLRGSRPPRRIALPPRIQSRKNNRFLPSHHLHHRRPPFPLLNCIFRGHVIKNRPHRGKKERKRQRSASAKAKKVPPTFRVPSYIFDPTRSPLLLSARALPSSCSSCSLAEIGEELPEDTR